jgi:glycosyltransferase involved in cell wall biosynthesis
MVQDGVNGMVVDESSPGALATALERLLSDPALRRRLGEAGRATVQDWTQDRMAGAFLDAIGRW